MAELKPDHPGLARLGLQEFQAESEALPSSEGSETIPIRMSCPESFHDAIGRVDYWGFYEGFDENGNTLTRDWHGFTTNREPQAILGSADTPPYAIEWDTRRLPAQDSMAVMAVVHFRQTHDVVYITRPLTDIAKPVSRKTVKYIPAESLPKPFWSRAGQMKSCIIRLEQDPASLEQAELHVVIWDGGSGAVKSPFTLNGIPLPVAGDGRHDVLYRVIPVDPRILREDENRIEVLSDTEHHGIEVLRPGPALMVRYAQD